MTENHPKDQKSGEPAPFAQTSPIAAQTRRVKILAEAAMMISVAAVLNLVTQFVIFNQGGAVTIGGMVPILLLALRRGPKVGIAAGAVLSVIIFNLPGQGFAYTPLQFLLDYPLAWGALGLAGFFKNQPPIGVGAGILGRFIFHFISGVLFINFFAASIAAQGTTAVIIYSVLYNGSYLLPEFIISEIIMVILVSRNLLRVYL